MKLDKKDKLIIGLLIVIVFVFANNHYNAKNDDNLVIEKSDFIDQEALDKESYDENISNIKKVHISGEINNSGVYEINDGDRLEDLVKKAGGLTDKANLDNINLSMILEDQMRIIIPNIDDTDNNINSSQFIGSVSDDKININKASKEELMTLPNIGEKRAESIIEYRQSQRFEKIEDIKNVNGIGDKYFEQMKDLIKTN